MPAARNKKEIRERNGGEEKGRPRHNIIIRKAVSGAPEEDLRNLYGDEIDSSKHCPTGKDRAGGPPSHKGPVKKKQTGSERAKEESVGRKQAKF